jgi:isocitrate lyase
MSMNVPTVLVARTDAEGAKLFTNDIDPIDRQFTTGERTVEGFFRIRWWYRLLQLLEV